MLNKVKVGIVVAAVLSLLRVVFTDVTWTEGIESSLVIVIVFFSQFFMKETSETITKLKLRVPRLLGRRRLWTMWVFLFVLLLPATMFAQGYDKTRGRPEAEKSDAKIQLQIERFTFGIGAFLNQPSLSGDMLFGSIQFHGVGLPFIREGTSTGIALEGHITKIFTEEIGNVTVQSFETMDWRIWSITRMPMSAIPVKAFQNGVLGRMFMIADVLLIEGGPVDWTDGFDARIGFGGDLGVLGPGNLVFEVYMFQQDIPFAVSLGYGF